MNKEREKAIREAKICAALEGLVYLFQSTEVISVDFITLKEALKVVSMQYACIKFQ